MGKISQKYSILATQYNSGFQKCPSLEDSTCHFILQGISLIFLLKICSNIDDDEDLWLFCLMNLHCRVGDGFHFCTL